MRGVTCNTVLIAVLRVISTHTPHARRDKPHHFLKNAISNFNSHASCEAWRRVFGFLLFSYDFNSHASCEAWPCIAISFRSLITISTHTPHARRDANDIFVSRFNFKISTHTPHARRDFGLSLANFIISANFNSHASCEAWREAFFRLRHSIHISTHTPHARRDVQTAKIANKIKISTHTPHARRDSSQLKRV